MSRPKTSVRAFKILEKKQAFGRGHPWPEGADVHDPKGFPKTSVDVSDIFHVSGSGRGRGSPGRRGGGAGRVSAGHLGLKFPPSNPKSEGREWWVGSVMVGFGIMSNHT